MFGDFVTKYNLTEQQAKTFADEMSRFYRKNDVKPFPHAYVVASNIGYTRAGQDSVTTRHAYFDLETLFEVSLKSFKKDVADQLRNFIISPGGYSINRLSDLFDSRLVELIPEMRFVPLMELNVRRNEHKALFFQDTVIQYDQGKQSVNILRYVQTENPEIKKILEKIGARNMETSDEMKKVRPMPIM